MTLDPMAVLLAAIVVLITWSFYRLHRDPNTDFNVLDLLMENGRVSKISCAFLAAFGITSWIMVKLTLDGKMTEGYLGLYGSMWVGPLIARVVFGKHEYTEQKP